MFIKPLSNRTPNTRKLTEHHGIAIRMAKNRQTTNVFHLINCFNV